MKLFRSNAPVQCKAAERVKLLFEHGELGALDDRADSSMPLLRYQCACEQSVQRELCIAGQSTEMGIDDLIVSPTCSRIASSISGVSMVSECIECKTRCAMLVPCVCIPFLAFLLVVQQRVTGVSYSSTSSDSEWTLSITQTG